MTIAFDTICFNQSAGTNCAANPDLTIILLLPRGCSSIESHLNAMRQAVSGSCSRCEMMLVMPGTPAESTPSYENVRIFAGACASTGTLVTRALRESRGRWILIPGLAPDAQARLAKALISVRREKRVVVATPEGRVPSLRDRTYSWFLSLGARHVTSAALILDRACIRPHLFGSRSTAVFLELLAHAKALGFLIDEVALSGVTAFPQHAGRAGILDLLRVWKFRNSFQAADYDLRAHDSIVLPQRFWQRRRFRLVTALAKKCSSPGLVLDIGCGSSRILGALGNAVGVDINPAKLRVQQQLGCRVVRASVTMLPFRGDAFGMVVSSQMVEHLSEGMCWTGEVARVLAPNGTAIIGTPDYGRAAWRVVESLYRVIMPYGYADDHLSKYTADSLDGAMAEVGFSAVEKHYICGGEMVAAYRREAHQGTNGAR